MLTKNFCTLVITLWNVLSTLNMNLENVFSSGFGKNDEEAFNWFLANTITCDLWYITTLEHSGTCFSPHEVSKTAPLAEGKWKPYQFGNLFEIE